MSQSSCDSVIESIKQPATIIKEAAAATVG
jgi:hypothetical protein